MRDQNCHPSQQRRCRITTRVIRSILLNLFQTFFWNHVHFRIHFSSLNGTHCRQWFRDGSREKFWFYFTKIIKINQITQDWFSYLKTITKFCLVYLKENQWINIKKNGRFGSGQTSQRNGRLWIKGQRLDPRCWKSHSELRFVHVLCTKNAVSFGLVFFTQKHWLFHEFVVSLHRSSLRFCSGKFGTKT